MAKMTQAVMDTINHEFCYWATADKNGVPHLEMQGSTTPIDTSTILMVPRFKNQTFNNLLVNPKAAIIAYTSLPHDKTKAQNDTLALINGFQIKGTATVLTSGEAYEQTKKVVAERIHPKMVEVMEQSVIFKVEEVYSAGLKPEDGKRIA